LSSSVGLHGVDRAADYGNVDGLTARDIGEPAQIHDIPDLAPLTRSRPDLLPAEEALSLPAPEIPADYTLVTLGRMLGARFTVDSPAWRGDPVPAMRSLQKRIVEHSLTLEESARAPAMQAIRVVEMAVRWRLRWQQMKRSEAESTFIHSEEERQEHGNGEKK